MPLSSDPEKAANSMANLRRGGDTRQNYPAPPRGNTRRLIHGGRSEVAIASVVPTFAERIHAELATTVPLRDPVTGDVPIADTVIVGLLAQTLARLEALNVHLQLKGPLDEKGNVRPAEEMALRLRREAAKYADQLGMTPLSRARLGLDLARGQRELDQAEAMAEAKRVRALVDGRLAARDALEAGGEA